MDRRQRATVDTPSQLRGTGNALVLRRSLVYSGLGVPSNCVRPAVSTVPCLGCDLRAICRVVSVVRRLDRFGGGLPSFIGGQPSLFCKCAGCLCGPPQHLEFLPDGLRNIAELFGRGPSSLGSGPPQFGRDARLISICSHLLAVLAEPVSVKHSFLVHRGVYAESLASSELPDVFSLRVSMFTLRASSHCSARSVRQATKEEQ